MYELSAAEIDCVEGGIGWGALAKGFGLVETWTGVDPTTMKIGLVVYAGLLIVHYATIFPLALTGFCAIMTVGWLGFARGRIQTQKTQ